jgi:hypothetical protein
MMKKLMLFVILLVSTIFMFSCSSRDLGPIDDDNHDDRIELTDSNVLQRKMVYKVVTNLRVYDLKGTVEQIKSELESDEWLDRETVSKNHAYLHIRIKTARLDDFLLKLQDYQMETFEKSGTDISLSYQDKTEKIVSLEAQRTRLVQLYNQATLSDMIIINKQISDLDVQLAKLKGELIMFDSLVEYSEVIITIYESTVITQSSFLNRLLNALLLGVFGILKLIEGALLAIAFLLPILAVMVPLGFGIYKGVKWYEKRQKNRKNMS